MPNFKFIKQFSTQVSSGGFNNQISNKTIPQGTVLSGKYVDNKTNGTKEVNVVISYIPIQGQTDSVSVPLSYVVQTTEPVSKTFYGAFISDEAKSLLFDNLTPPTKKYVFLEDYKTTYINYIKPPLELGGVAPTQHQLTPIPIEFKEGDIVEGIYKTDGSYGYIEFIYNNNKFQAPFSNRGGDILKEVSSESNSTPNKNKEKPTTTTENPTFFNKKNITTGVFVLVGIGVTLALLKWKKII